VHPGCQKSSQEGGCSNVVSPRVSLLRPPGRASEFWDFPGDQSFSRESAKKLTYVSAESSPKSRQSPGAYNSTVSAGFIPARHNVAN